MLRCALLIVTILYSFDPAITDNFIDIIFGSFFWFAFTIGIYSAVRARLAKMLSK